MTLSLLTITCSYLLVSVGVSQESFPASIISTSGSPLVKKQNVTLLASINFNSVNFPLREMCTKGIQLALDRIEIMPNLLASYRIIVEPYDDMCTQTVIIRELIAKMSENDQAPSRFPLMTGSLCSGQINQGQILHHYNFAGVTAASVYLDIFNDRQRYSSFYPLNASPTTTYKALVSFMAEVGGWHRLAVISDATSYFGPFENELLRHMETRNMSLIGIFKIPFESGKLPEYSGIQAAVEDLAASNARIIVVHSNWQHLIACWFHRYGLYGPNYAYFGLAFSQYQITSKLPYKWCTETMLADVLKSNFFYGETIAGIVFGPNATDETGLSAGDFDSAIRMGSIIDETSTLWTTWRTFCYEQTLFSAFWLNATEEILKTRNNQTLSDWFTNGSKFMKNGREILLLLKESIGDVKFRGLQGSYAFNRWKETNEGGLTYGGISQIQPNLASRFVAFFEGGQDVVIINRSESPVVWRSFGGSPPLDHEQIVAIAEPLLSLPLSAAIIGAGLLAMVLSTTLLIVQLCQRLKDLTKVEAVASRRKSNQPVDNCPVLIGNVVMLSHVLVVLAVLMEPDKPTLQLNCSAIYFLAITGTALSLSNVACRLELGVIVFINWCDCRSIAVNKTPPPVPLPEATLVDRHIKIRRFMNGRNIFFAQTFAKAQRRAIWFALFWTLTVAVVTTIWLSTEGVMKTAVQLKSVTHEGGVSFHRFAYSCNVDLSTAGARGHILAVAALIGVPLLRGDLIAISLRSKRFYDLCDWSGLCACIFGQSSLLAAATIAGVIFWNASSPAGFHATISIYAITFAAINLITLFLPSKAKQNISSLLLLIRRARQQNVHCAM